MPELPEVEAWVRELDPLVSAHPIERAGPAHVATLKTIDPPLSVLEGATRGRPAPGEEPRLPDRGRRPSPAGAPDERGPNPLPEAGSEGPEAADVQAAVLERRRAHPHRGGKKKRAGVWLTTPEQLEADLAHLGPDALDVDASSLAEILGRERRQLHPLLRDQRALAGIGRAHANEILLRARLSPFKASTELIPEETERLASAIHTDLERALELRLRGKGDRQVYVVHNHLGEPCPQCGNPIARVDFEEHTIFYCPHCQTGGRILKDRRLSRLLK